MSSSNEGLSEDHFKKLMNVITGMKREMEDKFTMSMDELQRKVTASQEDTLAQVNH